MSKEKDYIAYYKSKIDRYYYDVRIIAESLHKIGRVAVTADLLQETGLVQCVNNLRQQDNEAGNAANALYTKWKKYFDIAMNSKEIEENFRSSKTLEKHRHPSINDSGVFSKSSNESNISSCSGEDYTKNVFPSQLDALRFSNCSTFSEPLAKSSDQSQLDHREQFTSDQETSRPNSWSSSQNGMANMDSSHLDEDGNFNNPHLTIDNSVGANGSSQDEGANPGSSDFARTSFRDPYAIDLREGMFRTVHTGQKGRFANFSEVQDYIINTISRKIGETVREDDIRERYEFIPYWCRLHCKELQQRTPSKENSVRERPNRKSDHPRNGMIPSTSSHKTISGQSSNSAQKLKFNSHTHNSKVPDERIPHDMAAARHVPSVKPNSESKHFRDAADGIRRNHQSKNFPVQSKTDLNKSSRNTTVNVEVLNSVEMPQFKLGKEDTRNHNMPKVNNVLPAHSNCDRKPVRRPDSPDESAHFMTSRRERTSMYSGRRTMFEVLPLKQSCLQFLRRNLDCLITRGKVPYHQVQPIFESLNPSQLMRVEAQNPHYIKYTDDLWRKHYTREFRGPPSHRGDSWRNAYRKAQDEQNRKLKILSASISASASKVKPERQIMMTDVDNPPEPSRKKLKTGNSPVVSTNAVMPVGGAKLSPQVTLNRGSPVLNSKISNDTNSRVVTPYNSVPKAGSPSTYSVTSPVEYKNSSKDPKSKSVSKSSKKDAPMMSKIKKSLGLVGRPR